MDSVISENFFLNKFHQLDVLKQGIVKFLGLYNACESKKSTGSPLRDHKHSNDK